MPLAVLLRSFPPLPLYSSAGAVDGGAGGGEDCSGDCGNAGAARAGVGGFPGVLSTNVCVLLRPGGVEGCPGDFGTTSIVSSSCCCFRTCFSALSASLSAASEPNNDRAEALPWILIGLAHLGFFTLLGKCVGSKSSSIICYAKLNKALLIFISYSSKRALANLVSSSLIYINYCSRLEILLDYYNK